MKNKTLKNLIALGVFAFLIGGFNQASAYVVNPNYYTNQSITDMSMLSGSGPGYGYSSPVINSYQTQYQQPQAQPSYSYTDPYYYVQPSPQYVQQPQAPQVQYVQQPVRTVTQVQYVPQTVKATTVTPVVRNVNTVVAATNPNANYLNYDGNNPNLLGASVYGSQYSQPVVVTDSNGLTALSVGGSGGFMPSSVFQWFLVILLILAIVIIARMIGKTFSNTNHSAPAH